MKYIIREPGDPSNRELKAPDMRRARIPERYWQCTIDQIPSECSFLLKVKNYLDNLHTYLADGTGLYLWGDYGRGKTSTAAVIGKAAISRGGRVLFVSGEQLKDVLINKPVFDEQETIDKRLYNVDLLIFDDPERGAQGEWSQKAVEEVIRTRMDNKLATIISTNIAPKKVSTTFGEGLLTTLQRGCALINVDGPDWSTQFMNRINKELNSGQ